MVKSLETCKAHTAVIVFVKQNSGPLLVILLLLRFPVCCQVFITIDIHCFFLNFILKVLVFTHSDGSVIFVFFLLYLIATILFCFCVR